MGRKTYEFGYKFGLEPGQPAYPHMEHYIFSENLAFASQHEKVHVRGIDLKEIDRIRQEEGGDIYLCGGGQFAGWLLDHGRIDVVKIKLNPIILGQGVRLFGDSITQCSMSLVDTKLFEHGLQIMTCEVG